MFTNWFPTKPFLESLSPEVKPVFTLWKVFNLMFCLRCTSSTSAVIRESLLHFPIIAGNICSASISSSSYEPWQINFLASLGFFGEERRSWRQSGLPQKSRMEHFNHTMISTFQEYMLKRSILLKRFGKVTANFSSPSLSPSSLITLILFKVTRLRALVCSTDAETA